MHFAKSIAFLSSTVFLGLFTTGCGKIPTVPEKEKLQQMSLPEFLEHQHFHTSDKLSPSYKVQGTVNTKLDNAQSQAYDFGRRRVSALTAYCGAYGGQMTEREEYRNRITSISARDYTKAIAIDKEISQKVLGWDDIQTLCVVNNLPFFGYSVNGPYREQTRVDNMWWNIDVVVTPVRTIDEIKNSTNSFIGDAELSKANATARQWDKKNEERRLQHAAIDEQKLIEKQRLQNRKGEFVLTFYDKAVRHAPLQTNNYVVNSLNKALTYDADSCKFHCDNENEKTTGYESLQEALDGGWQFIQKVGDKSIKEINCECHGSQYLLKK